MLIGGIKIAALVVVVITGHRQHPVGYEVLTGAVRLYDGFDQVLRHIGVVGQELLGVFGQTITAVAKRRVVIMCADTRIKTNTVNDGLRVQAFHLGICVQFVEIAHAQSQIGVGE